MNGGQLPAVVIFFLLMCVKWLLLSLTPLLWYDTHKHTHTQKLMSVGALLEQAEEINRLYVLRAILCVCGFCVVWCVSVCV